MTGEAVAWGKLLAHAARGIVAALGLVVFATAPVLLGWPDAGGGPPVASLRFAAALC